MKNVPASLHRRLRKLAKKQSCTMSEVVLKAIRRELARAEFRERLVKRPRTKLGVSAAALLEEERTQRAHDLSP